MLFSLSVFNYFWGIKSSMLRYAALEYNSSDILCTQIKQPADIIKVNWRSDSLFGEIVSVTLLSIYEYVCIVYYFYNYYVRNLVLGLPILYL